MMPLESSAKAVSSPAILFTSVGRRVELVRVFRRAYESLGLQSNILAVDVDPLAPALQEADRSFLVPHLCDPAYISTLVNICRRESVKRIFPLIDPDIPVLAKHSMEFEATGARVATISAQAAAVTGDKWQTSRFFTRLGLLTPRCWLRDEIDAAALTYPLFIKPRYGSAGKDAFPVRNERELSFFLDYVPDPIVQEFLPGPEITCDVVCDVDGALLAVVARQRIEVREGEVSKGVTIYDASIVDTCAKIARALSAHGPITVQCMMKDGRPQFTEINARFGGGFPLAVAAGVRAPTWLIARAAGLPIDIPPLGTYERGLYLTRFHDSHFLTEADYGQMAGRRFRS
jgi:carbamoyl-phosphate synthase large subunit